MKTQMEEVEDDLAAEEENKLINEVRSRVFVLGVCTRSQNLGIQDLVRSVCSISVYCALIR
jgi:flagellar motor switch protein FliG